MGLVHLLNGDGGAVDSFLPCLRVSRASTRRRVPASSRTTGGSKKDLEDYDPVRQGFATTGEARSSSECRSFHQISMRICQDSAVILYDLAQEQAHSACVLTLRHGARCVSAFCRLHVAVAVACGPRKPLENNEKV